MLISLAGVTAAFILVLSYCVSLALEARASRSFLGVQILAPAKLSGNQLRTVKTGQVACETTLCAVEIGRWMAAPGTPSAGLIPNTIISDSRRRASSRIFSAGLPCSTKYSGLHQSEASFGTNFCSCAFDDSTTSEAITRS